MQKSEKIRKNPEKICKNPPHIFEILENFQFFYNQVKILCNILRQRITKTGERSKPNREVGINFLNGDNKGSVKLYINSFNL